MATKSAEQIIDQIKKLVTYDRTQAEIAADLGIDPALLSRALRMKLGAKQMERIALTLGYQQEVRYRKIAVDAPEEQAYKG